MTDRNHPPSQSIDAPRNGPRSDAPDSFDEKPNKPDTDVEHPADTGAVRNQSQVTPEDYPKEDGGRPDYGSPVRSDEEE